MLNWGNDRFPKSLLGILEGKISMKEFTVDVAIDFANRCLLQVTDKRLSKSESMVFAEAWNGRTYKEIADKHSYSATYLNNDVGFNLWRKLSVATGRDLGIRNFKWVLYQYWLTQKEEEPVEITPLDSPFLEYGERVDSAMYIKPKNFVRTCHVLLQGGSLVRIQAPRAMGKTSLMNQLIAHASHNGLRTARLDLDEPDNEIFTSTKSLLRWLCVKVSKQLNVENKIADIWSNDLGSTDNCTDYFENYLLDYDQPPLLLALDKVDRLFKEDRVLMDDFFGLLRSWYEQGKIDEQWRRFHLLIAHSTEPYVPMEVNSSPFGNVGEIVILEDLTELGVQELVKLYSLSWSETEVQKLMELVGGHPQLIRSALHAGASLSPSEILGDATSEVGIFGRYLKKLREYLFLHPELAEAYQTVINACAPIEVIYPLGFKLESLGLVRQQVTGFIPRYELYRRYFRQRL